MSVMSSYLNNKFTEHQKIDNISVYDELKYNFRLQGHGDEPNDKYCELMNTDDFTKDAKCVKYKFDNGFSEFVKHELGNESHNFL